MAILRLALWGVVVRGLRHFSPCSLDPRAIPVVIKINRAETSLAIDMMSLTMTGPCNEGVGDLSMYRKQAAVVRGCDQRGEIF